MREGRLPRSPALIAAALAGLVVPGVVSGVAGSGPAYGAALAGRPGQATGRAADHDSGLAIRSVTVTPSDPVVRAEGTVRLTIAVVARGAAGHGGVYVVVEPGAPGGVRRPAPRAPGGKNVGWETWLFLPSVELSRLYPSGRWTVAATARDKAGRTVTSYAAFFLRLATRFEGVRVWSEGDSARVTGRLTRLDPAAHSRFAPLVGRRVTIKLREAGARRWFRAGYVTTGRDGWFTARFPRRSGGSWQVVYDGDGKYAPKVAGAVPAPDRA